MGNKFKFVSDFPALQKFYGHLLFLIFFIYSLYYALERTCYVDSAWQFFQRVNDGDFVFPFKRYGVFFSEIPLYVAVKLHLPFRLLVYIFSSSYIVLYYLIWRLVTYTLRNPVAGLVIVLGIFMGVRENFLHTVGELHQAIVFSALLFAIMEFEWKTRYKKIIFGILCAFLVMFTHPLAAFAAGFAVMISMAFRKKITIEGAIILASIGITILLRFLFPDNVNDARQYNHVMASASGFHNLMQSGALRFLVIHSQHFYWLPELMFAFCITFLVVQRNYHVLSLFILSITGYMLLAVITFQDGDSSIMVERLFLPAFFMINLVFARSLAESRFQIRWSLVLLLFFAVNGIRYINAGCLLYHERNRNLSDLIFKTTWKESDKSFILKSDLDEKKFMVTWALGAESMIYSNYVNGKTTIVSADNGKCPEGMLQVADQSFYSAKDFNRNYFILSDHPYIRIK